jgi:high-affinity nickel permease
VITALAVGFLLGLRHALEADHIAAVAALVTGMASMKSAVWRGVFWGIGHTLTLLALGGTVAIIGAEISPAVERVFELIVGAMLVIIGFDTMRSWRRLHVHEHRHGDEAHVHIHAHDPEAPHTPAAHGHAHRVLSSGRALVVGLVHGLAGSAALVVLAAASLDGAAALGFVALFGIGSIVGMAVMSVVVTLPIQLSARLLRGRVSGIVFAAGAASAVVGVHLIWTVA